jgi:hypothetical protein
MANDGGTVHLLAGDDNGLFAIQCGTGQLQAEKWPLDDKRIAGIGFRFPGGSSLKIRTPFCANIRSIEPPALKRAIAGWWRGGRPPS